MCHSMMVGRKVLTARKPRPCPECSKLIEPGDEVVRENNRDEEDGHVFSRWICKRCAVRWEYATSESGGCPMDAREYVAEHARALGWRGMREHLRRALRAVRRGI